MDYVAPLPIVTVALLMLTVLGAGEQALKRSARLLNRWVWRDQAEVVLPEDRLQAVVCCEGFAPFLVLAASAGAISLMKIQGLSLSALQRTGCFGIAFAATVPLYGVLLSCVFDLPLVRSLSLQGLFAILVGLRFVTVIVVLLIPIVLVLTFGA